MCTPCVCPYYTLIYIHSYIKVLKKTHSDTYTETHVNTHSNYLFTVSVIHHTFAHISTNILHTLKYIH